MTIEISPATPAEYDAIGDLTARAYAPSHMLPDDPYFDYLRDVAERAAGSVVLAARNNGKVVGSVAWCEPGSEVAELAMPGEGEFRTLAVDPEAEGGGAGRALVQACIDRAREAGCDALVLSSALWMTRAHGLYERMGFVRVPERDWNPTPDTRLLAFRLELR